MFQLPWTTWPFHKSLATCTVSLAHAEVVSEVDKSQDVNCAPQLSVHRAEPMPRNVIPFPTLPSAISSRPLPLPPKTHALLRTTSRMTSEFDFATRRSRKTSLSPLSPKPTTIVAPGMQRRRSRDPNVADRLVVELDDEDHNHTLPPRPSSPSPEPQEQASRGQHRSTKLVSDIPTNPDPVPPPAYSTLPPPYSATTDEKKDVSLSFTVVVEKDEEQPASDKPPPATPQASSSSSSSASSSSISHKRSRVSTSELRVLVYLYRTVVFGLEMRNRKEKESALDIKQPSVSLDAPRPTKKKPLGPRSSPSAPPPSCTASLIPPPEDKLHFESALAAASAKASRHSPGGFADFPLVEDDLDSDKDKDKDYITPRTPFHSPSQSPRSSSPPPSLHASPSLDAVASYFASPTLSNSKPKKEKTKTEINAELHVQDALLALRLKEFLRAHGVCEDDLRVDFDDEGCMVEAENGKVLDEPKEETIVQAQQEGDEESNILDAYFMGIEEEPSGPAKKDRGPVVEDDDVVVQPKLDSPFVEEDDPMSPVSSPPSPPTTPSLPLTLQVATIAQRISSPPPSSPSPRPHAVLPTSYMVALLTMRVRHPSKKPGLSSSGSTSSGNEKGKEGKVKRKSGLSVVVEVD